jgi:hypothetical protein
MTSRHKARGPAGKRTLFTDLTVCHRLRRLCCNSKRTRRGPCKPKKHPRRTVPTGT